MSLAPDLLLGIEELKTFDSTIQHVEPADIVHVIPLGGAIRD
jgi:hypothetical protein